jgi:hypothetical protein
MWAALKNYVVNTAVSRPGRLRHVHSFFRNRSPGHMSATAALRTSPWLPPGYEQNFWMPLGRSRPPLLDVGSRTGDLIQFLSG